MSTHKYIDRICCGAMALAVLLAVNLLERREDRRRQEFPESNRLFKQLQILLGAQGPMLGSLFRRKRLHLRGCLAAASAKCRAAFGRRRLRAPVFLAGAAAVAVPVVFFSLSTVTNGILQGINRMRVPVRNALIALILHVGILIILLYGLDTGIYGVVIANMLFGLTMCILNGISIANFLGYRQFCMGTL